MQLFSANSPRIAAIIMECNPLHDGHRYIIRKARRVTGADYVFVVMSGDFVQRGLPAIASKEERARSILEAGADLVLEIPLYYATGAANYFARGAVTLLSSLGCVTDLCFGSESGDLTALQNVADFLSGEETPGFQNVLKAYLAEGLSYPTARTKAAQSLGISLPTTANDVLGAEYLRYLPDSITPHAIPRIKAESASTLRDAACKADPEHTISADTYSLPMLHALWQEVSKYQTCSLCDHEGDKEDSFELDSIFNQASGNTFTSYVDVTHALADKIVKNLSHFTTTGDFCMTLKSKDLTYTRISRALLHILLHVRKDHLQRYLESGMIGYARVLGFRRESAGLLTAIHGNSSVPLVTSCAKALQTLPPIWQQMLSEDIAASEFYDLMARQIRGGEGPVTKELSKQLIIL